ncbi:head GIN domain-containing protein [Sphingobacterium sp. LRF_L2]|uniref:head GIN domain-containing protein n=1 Tax=Sphingobacterium sp. LRF_L2 TaxID=3369421 RepID=UPI003F5FB3CF
MSTKLVFLFAGILSLSFAKAQIEIPIGSFKELDVTDKLNVEIIVSDKNVVSIEGELSDKVEVIQKEDKLRIKMTNGYPLKGVNTFIKVYASNFSDFLIQKGAIVQTNGDKIVADTVAIWANEGGKIDVNLQASHVVVNSTTGANITLQGETKSQNVNSTFGGNYYARNLKSSQVVARTNGGGVCEVNASVSADVQTRAGGVINIYGNPSERKQKRLAGGKINFITEN